MPDTSQGLSQRQSRAEHQPKWAWIGPTALRRQVGCFFLSESILKASIAYSETQSLCLIITEEKVIFPLWTSDNTIEYQSSIGNRKYLTLSDVQQNQFMIESKHSSTTNPELHYIFLNVTIFWGLSGSQEVSGPLGHRPAPNISLDHCSRKITLPLQVV